MTKFILDIVKCPRCTQDHQALVFEFTNPIVIGSETWTHFAYCENWDEPILIVHVGNGECTISFWRFA
jgi:hypothetical protein